jgi:hypothetical protein
VGSEDFYPGIREYVKYFFLYVRLEGENGRYAYGLVDRPAVENESEVTPEMIRAAVQNLTGFNHAPYFQPVSWERIVRDVYSSMREAR